MHKCVLHSFIIQEPVAGAVLLVVRAVRRADRADLRQVADAADVHLDRHDQLRRLEHPLPRRHHLLQQPRRRQAVQGGHQEEIAVLKLDRLPVKHGAIMGRTCCVPGCRTGYSGPVEGVSLHSFPKDEHRLQQWIRAIPRDD